MPNGNLVDNAVEPGRYLLQQNNTLGTHKDVDEDSWYTTQVFTMLSEAEEQLSQLSSGSCGALFRVVRNEPLDH